MCRLSGSLNLLEPSGPVKTCNAIALTFIYISIVEGYVCENMKQRTPDASVTIFSVQLSPLHTYIMYYTLCIIYYILYIIYKILESSASQLHAENVKQLYCTTVCSLMMEQ